MKEFLLALLGNRGDLDAWLECNSEQECRDVIIPIVRQRDELLAALEHIARLSYEGKVCHEIQYSLGDIAKDAIAKARGQQ